MNKKFNNYFPHETNPRTNRNLKALFTAYGAEGYGNWWILQEILCQQPGYKLDITQEYAYNELADDMRCEPAYLETFINDCVRKFHLLECDETHLWCPALILLMQPLEEKRAVLSANGKKGAEAKHKKLANAKENDSPAKALPTNFIAEKSKEEKSKEKKIYPGGNSTDSFSADNNIALPQPLYNGLTDIALLTQRVLADDIHFCSYHIRPGGLKDKAALEGWLLAFNKWLRYGGEHIRNENSYRVHFKNWIVRQDLRKDPARYDPVTDTTAYKPKGSIPLEMPRQTAEQAIAEREAAKQEIIRKMKTM